MSIVNYTELQSAVSSWLHRADLSGIVPDLITFGEKRIFRNVRCRSMESSLSGTISSGVLTVPSDYLELKYAYLDTTPVSTLKRSSASQILTQYPLRVSDRKPTCIARDGTNFIFGPYPDSDYDVKGIYYAKPTSIATATNALFTDNQDLYLFAALCESAPYIKDDNRLPIWEAKLAQIMSDIRDEDADESSSGGGLMVRAA